MLSTSLQILLRKALLLVGLCAALVFTAIGVMSFAFAWFLEMLNGHWTQVLWNTYGLAFGMFMGGFIIMMMWCVVQS